MSRRYFVFSIFLIAYFTSVFSRSTNAAIAEDLQTAFSLSPAELGLMTSLFLVAVAAMQLPFGIALDRYGARLTTAITMGVGMLGAYLFSIAESNAMLMLGRALIGVGVSGILMGAFVSLGEYFTPKRYNTIIGILVSLGAVGSIVASKPLIHLNTLIGWRMIFFYLAITFGVVAIGIALIVRRGPLQSNRPQPDPLQRDPLESNTDTTAKAAEQNAQLIDIFRNKDFWRIGILDFAMAGGFFAFQGLWLAPYLENGLGFSKEALGNGLMLLNIGVVLGYLISGWLCDRFSIKWIMATCGTMMLANSLYLGLMPTQSLQQLAWLRHINILSFGLMGAASVHLITQARMLFPSYMAGRASTACNLLGFGGSALVQWFLGVFVGLFTLNGTIPAHAYRWMFVVVSIILVIGLIGYVPLLLRDESIASTTS